MENNGQGSSSSFERSLRNYQKASLFLFYPALISFMSAAIGAFSSTYDYSLAFASTRTLMIYLRDTPIAGNLVLSLFIGVTISLAVCVFYGLLTFQVAKGKIKYLYIGAPIYVFDAVYGAFLINSSFYASMSPLTYGVNLALHIAFIVLFVFLAVDYGKLKRFVKSA